MENINNTPNTDSNFSEQNQSPRDTTNKKLLVILVTLVILAVVGLFFVYKNSQNNNTTVVPDQQTDDTGDAYTELDNYFINSELKTVSDVLPPEVIKLRMEEIIKTNEAEIKIEEAKEDGNPYSGYLGVANTYRQLGDFSKSLDAYSVVIDKYPNDFLVWHNLGVLHEDMQQYLEAARAYSRSIDNKPVESMAYLKLADLYVRYSNDSSKAQEVYEEAVVNTEENIQVLKFYAAYLEDVLQDNQEAVIIWNKVLEKDPNNQDIKDRILDLQ